MGCISSTVLPQAVQSALLSRCIKTLPNVYIPSFKSLHVEYFSCEHVARLISLPSCSLSVAAGGVFRAFLY